MGPDIHVSKLDRMQAHDILSWCNCKHKERSTKSVFKDIESLLADTSLMQLLGFVVDYIYRINSTYN